jgi:tetratricopeptide (TPR) repeat protein
MIQFSGVVPYRLRGSMNPVSHRLGAVAGLLSLCAVPAHAQWAADGYEGSTLGSYISGRIARGQNDTAAAVGFYRRALKAAPDNPEILESAFLVEASEGNAERAVDLARQLIRYQPQHRLAQAWLGIAAFRAGKLISADRHFKASATGPIGELTSALSRAWVAKQRGRSKLALSQLKYSQRAEWAQYYLRYHRALIADLSGRRKLARQNFSRIFKSDARMPRITVGYLHHAAAGGGFNLAETILEKNAEATTGARHPAVEDVAKKLRRRERLPVLITNPNDGLAEVYYGLGEALTTEGGMQLGAIYLQMALYLRPDFDYAHAALANVYETNKDYARANAVYDRISARSPLQLLVKIRRASNLDQQERTDEGIAVLKDLIRDHPQDLRPLEAIATMLRGRKRYREAIKYYDRIIDAAGEPEPSHWTYWYARGTSHERLKDWPSAERDLLFANNLNPDQPLILNYLGYSWVDRNMNLNQGLEYIERAVELKPDDGYIVDSLGWAHFRLGDYAKAAEHLERAVELRPSDPILNDHLGDALWRIGRIREARFQWEQALTLEPEAEDERRIRDKLARGLPPIGAIETATPEKAKKKGATLGKRVESFAAPAPLQ